MLIFNLNGYRVLFVCAIKNWLKPFYLVPTTYTTGLISYGYVAKRIGQERHQESI